MGRSAKFYKKPSKAAVAAAAVAAPGGGKNQKKASSSSASVKKTVPVGKRATAAAPSIHRASAIAAASRANLDDDAMHTDDAAMPTNKTKGAKGSSKPLGKYEISIDRPDYIDMLSGRKTFRRDVREKVLKVQSGGKVAGERVVVAKAVKRVLEGVRAAAAASSGAAGRNA
ncbi:hypothetical protein BC828DRAFT_377521 [Blastocladiella britannica]|nr:hypothetical protein BC828DRAFT_377521 [Blastocladiella britannica]